MRIKKLIDRTHITRQTLNDLQEQHYLPPSALKKILKKQKKSYSGDLSLLHIKSKDFKPLDRFLSTELVGIKRLKIPRDQPGNSGLPLGNRYYSFQ